MSHEAIENAGEVDYFHHLDPRGVDCQLTNWQ